MNFTLVLSILILLYLTLIWKAGSTYPIIYLFLFTFFLQYIFSTYLVYNEYKVLRDQMPIKQDQFFDYTIPALLFLFLGVFAFNREIELKTVIDKIDTGMAARLGYLLVIISYGFDIVGLFGISMFNSIISFTAYLKYLAVFCLIFSRSTFRYILSAVIYVQLVWSVLRIGVFIDFITWGIFLFFFISLRFRLSFLMRGALFVSAIPVLILIQSVKDEYRKATWKKGQEAGIQLFSDLAEKKSKEDISTPYEKSEGFIRTIARLTQGWHLGLTLKRVPAKEGFANGEEMLSDIASSILPRILFQDKKTIHTKEKFYKYTGHKLGSGTSMTIGLLGDFYINYGRTGSYVMLFIFGALISKLVSSFIIRFVLNDPINIIWLPFFLSYLVRADNDFYVFFNSLVKGVVIFIVINYIRQHYLDPKQIFVKAAAAS